MATVRPFPALRYNVERFPNLAEVLAPPYDIISPADQQALYDRHPQNVIRLEYGQQSAQDTPEENRYTRARATLESWLRAQALIMETPPCFYPHRQRFTWEGEARARQGFFAAVRLQPFDEGDVLPHEWTLKGPKEDRLKLMRACLASFSPIFGLYDGANSEIGDCLRRVTAHDPLAIAAGHGFDETLWRSADPALNATIADALSHRQILIADGHHRYETMLALRDLLRTEFPDAPENAAINYAFMLLVDLHDPGLLVLPTHRLLLLTSAMRDAFCRVASRQFQMEKLGALRADAVEATLARYAGMHAFIWYERGCYTLLTSPTTLINGLPVLDVVALQDTLIAPLLAESLEGDATIERNVRYTHDAADAVARVDAGEAQAAVFLNPTPVKDVLTLAAAGVRLPQKSTYFYPKVPTGLVMYNLQPEVTVG